GRRCTTDRDGDAPPPPTRTAGEHREELVHAGVALSGIVLQAPRKHPAEPARDPAPLRRLLDLSAHDRRLEGLEAVQRRRKAAIERFVERRAVAEEVGPLVDGSTR